MDKTKKVPMTKDEELEMRKKHTDGEKENPPAISKVEKADLAEQLKDAEARATKAEAKLEAIKISKSGKRELLIHEIHNTWEGVDYKEPYYMVKGRQKDEKGKLFRPEGRMVVDIGRKKPITIRFKDGVGVSNSHAAIRKLYNAMVTSMMGSYNPKGKPKTASIELLKDDD